MDPGKEVVGSYHTTVQGLVRASKQELRLSRLSSPPSMSSIYILCDMFQSIRFFSIPEIKTGKCLFIPHFLIWTAQTLYLG